MKRGFGEDTLGFHGACNSLVGLLTKEARQNTEPLFDELRRRLKPYGMFAITPLGLQASNLSLTGELTGLATISFFMPAIFLLVAVLVLNVLMSRLVQQQRTIVGTLKALGYRNLDIFFHFIQFGVFVGTGGALLGCLLGYWIADAMTIQYRSFFDFPRLDNQFYPGLNLVALVISLVFGIIGTLKGIRTGAEPESRRGHAAPAASGRRCGLFRVVDRSVAAIGIPAADRPQKSDSEQGTDPHRHFFRCHGSGPGAGHLWHHGFPSVHGGFPI